MSAFQKRSADFFCPKFNRQASNSSDKNSSSLSSTAAASVTLDPSGVIRDVSSVKQFRQKFVDFAFDGGGKRDA